MSTPPTLLTGYGTLSFYRTCRNVVYMICHIQTEITVNQEITCDQIITGNCVKIVTSGPFTCSMCHQCTANQHQNNQSITFANSLTATGTHIPYEITQCYLPPGRGDIPAFRLYPSQLKQVLDLATPDGCKTELI